MSDTQEIVMFDGPEAATYRTDIKGWIDRNGFFHGEYERGARWSGCTHMTCACGRVYEKERVRCDSCQAAEDSKRFEALEEVEWDEETPLAVFGDDRYFWSLEELLDYLAETKVSDKDTVRVCLCDPVRLGYISEDQWCDDLPEDGELPDEVAIALEALNSAIKEAGPVSWREGKKRIKLDAYWKQIESEREAKR